MSDYIIDIFGDKYWYLNGVRHREDGPAVERSDGYKAWYLNGELHREDGPAAEFADGSKFWWFNGKRHREDGPADEYMVYGRAYKRWWYNDEKINCETNEEFLKLIKFKAFW